MWHSGLIYDNHNSLRVPAGALRKASVMSQARRPLYPQRRHRTEFLLLALAWLSPTDSGHLGSDLAETSYLSPSQSPCFSKDMHKSLRVKIFKKELHGLKKKGKFQQLNSSSQSITVLQQQQAGQHPCLPQGTPKLGQSARLGAWQAVHQNPG